jgi:23S rRNA (cytidine1920-2'-O)/16S rRNA (cytidine1409-2'-O)-methyltransferase
MRKRADQLLVEQGLCESRTLAQRLIQAGKVRIGDDHVIPKPSILLDETVELRLIEGTPYVSRGADKLLPALDRFLPSVAHAIAMDIGASTGGFTDLLLQRGAQRVYAVDVGYGQLHVKLRNDPRVIVLERVNARHLTQKQIPEPVEIMVSDVSFISLTKIIPACAPLIRPGGWVFLLIKPQFEAERHEVGKNGVVRDEAIQQRCIEKICSFAKQGHGWECLDVIPSPVKGPKGNQEYIAVFRTPADKFNGERS